MGREEAMMRWKALSMFVVFPGLILATHGFAKHTYEPLSELAVIRGGNPEIARILVRFDLSRVVEENNLDYAEIQFPPFVGTQGEDLTVQGFRLTRDWDEETVTWESPWAIPGGDYDSTGSVAFRCGPRDTLELHLDITDLFRPLFEGDPNYGFILKRPSWEGDGFGAEGELLYQALLREGKVSIYYTMKE